MFDKTFNESGDIDELARELEYELEDEYEDGGIDSIDEIRLHLCDACHSTWATAAAGKGSARLYFCQHHFRLHVAELIGAGFDPIDPVNAADFGEGFEHDRLQGDDHS